MFKNLLFKSIVVSLKCGGLMKGFLMGGIVGLLFGSLLFSLGLLGLILGFMVNMFVIVVLIFFVVKLF